MVDEKLKALSTRVVALEMRMKAANQEFLAAVIVNDAKEQERLRDNLHTMLDALLDNTVEIGFVGRENGTL